MKKLILLTLSILFFGTSFGQTTPTSVTIVTHYVTIEDMVWNSINDDWDYVVKVPRYKESARWTFTLKDNNTGLISMEELGDGDNYYLEIYDWKPEDFKGRDGIVAQFVQRSNGDKGTLMIQWNEGIYGISIFIPERKSYLFFDNM